jgi:hypothetical protein
MHIDKSWVIFNYMIFPFGDKCKFNTIFKFQTISIIVCLSFNPHQLNCYSLKYHDGPQIPLGLTLRLLSLQTAFGLLFSCPVAQPGTNRFIKDSFQTCLRQCRTLYWAHCPDILTHSFHLGWCDDFFCIIPPVILQSCENYWDPWCMVLDLKKEFSRWSSLVFFKSSLKL